MHGQLQNARRRLFEERPDVATRAKRDKKAAREARFPVATEAQWKEWSRGLGGYFAGSKTVEWAVKWVEKKFKA